MWAPGNLIGWMIAIIIVLVLLVIILRIVGVAV
jgi:hypothetical protein